MRTPETATARRRLVLLVVVAVLAVNAAALTLMVRREELTSWAWAGLLAMLLGLAGVITLGLAVVLRGRGRSR